MYWDYIDFKREVLRYYPIFGKSPNFNRIGVVAIGSGSRYALGRLYGTVNPGEKDVLDALRAASEHDAGTGGKLTVERVN